MNKILLILVSIFFSYTTVQSQNLVTEGNRWITTTVGGSFSPQLEIWRSDRLYEIPLVNTDSSFNNQNYMKLFLEDDFTSYSLVGLLRETVDSIVYFLPKNDSLEKILYDFGAQIGDTIQNYYSTQSDVMVTDTFDRGIEITSFGLEEFWLYGIGGETGFLETGYGPLMDIGRNLTCMSDINGKRYPPGDTTTSLCERAIVGISNRAKDDFELKISPNPITTSFQINNEDLGDFTLSIIDLNGSLVFLGNYEEGQTLIDNDEIMNLSKGVYTAIIESSSKGTGFVKVIK